MYPYFHKNLGSLHINVSNINAAAIIILAIIKIILQL